MEGRDPALEEAQRTGLSVGVDAPIDPWALLDPELRDAALYMRDAMAPLTPMTLEKLPARRAWIAAGARPALAEPAVTEHRVALGGGKPDVTVYVVNAKPGDARAGILHIHGGGFTASTALSGIVGVQKTALALDCPIVTVDYRLAPETLWSDALDDTSAALGWMHDHAAQIGVDPARIGLLGESAGGGHAANLAIFARDRGGPAIAFQALIYPMLDDRTGTSRATPAHIGALGWNAEANRFGWASVLGADPGGDAHREGVPARVADLAGLPPTFIGVGALDLFVEEDIAFSTRLLAAGVPTELVVVPGAHHGFDMLVETADVSRRFTATKLDALRRGLRMVERATEAAPMSAFVEAK